MAHSALRGRIVGLCEVAKVATAQYGALVFALVTGPALLVGLVFGTGTALLVELPAAGGERLRSVRQPDARFGRARCRSDESH